MWSFRMIILNMRLRKCTELCLGGRLTSYESVVERARREAIVTFKIGSRKNRGDSDYGHYGSAPLNSVCKVEWLKSLPMEQQLNLTPLF